MNNNYNKLIKNANLFYNGYMTEISDKEYDDLLDEQLKIDPKFNIFNLLTFEEEINPESHLLPYDKIEKVKVNNVSELPLYSTIQGKYDGCSIAVYYKYGQLYKILTRSDEITGKIQTHKLKNKVPQFIEEFKDYEIVRLDCEAVCSYRIFDEKARQKANGLINSKFKQEEVDQYIHLIAFSNSENIQLDIIEQNNLDKAIDINFIVAYDVLGKRINCLIDGYVCDKTKIYKFYFQEAKSSIVNEIIWNMKDTFRFIPTLKFDSIMLNGSNIQKCSINYKALVEKKINIGSEIQVILSGATIPVLKNVITTSNDDIMLPECGCGNQTVNINNNIMCVNTSCNVIKNHIDKLISKFNKSNFYELTQKEKISLLILSSVRHELPNTIDECLNSCTENQKLYLHNNNHVISYIKSKIN